MSLATLTSDLTRPQILEAGLEGVAATADSTASQARKAFDALARFIPTEALAPFIMAMQIASGEGSTWNQATVYWAFVIATPFLLVIFEYARTASSTARWPDKRELTWRAIAACIAFAVWGLSVPGNTYQEALGGVAFTGLMAVSISPLLTAIDAIVIRVLREVDAGKNKDPKDKHPDV